jgi:hypothetical protein
MANPTQAPANPDQMTDSQFYDTLASGVQLKSETPMTDQQYWDSLAQQAKETKVPGVVEPETPVGQEPPKQNRQPLEGFITAAETLPAEINKERQQFYDIIQADNQIGVEGLHEGEEGALAVFGKQTYEDAEKHLESDKLQAEQNQTKLEAFRGTIPAYKALAWMIDPVAQTLPMLTRIAAASGAGAAAGGFTAGLAEGLATGPAAPVVSPTAAIANGALAGTSAVYAAMAIDSTGRNYMKYRRLGHTHDESALWGTANGMVQGVISSLRFGQLEDVARKETADLALPMLWNGIKQVGRTMAIQGGLGAYGETADLTMDAALAATSNKKGERLTWDDVANRISKATADAAVLGMAGHVATEGAKQILFKAPKTLNATLRVVGQVFRNPDKDLAELAPIEPVNQKN